MSKVLEPIELLIPIEPCPLNKIQHKTLNTYFINNCLPCFATITLETASGTLVPAARKVIPITESGIFNVSPEKY